MEDATTVFENYIITSWSWVILRSDPRKFMELKILILGENVVEYHFILTGKSVTLGH